MKKIINFRKLIPKFNIFIFDVYGTIVNIKNNSKNINKIFNEIKKNKRKKIYIVTNSSKSSEQTKKFLIKEKININFIDKIFTSSEIAIEIFTKNKKKINNQKLYFSGKNKYLLNELKKRKFNFSETILNSEYFIFANKTNDTKVILRKIDNFKKIFLINSDLFDIKNNKLLGYYINKYIKNKKKIINLGKPTLYNYIIENKITLGEKILIIGDSFAHDFCNTNKSFVKTLNVKNNTVNKNDIVIKILTKNFKKINYQIEKLKF